MDYDNFISGLESDIKKATPPKVETKAKGLVQPLDETILPDPDSMTDDAIDVLFGPFAKYTCYGGGQKEKPVHRLILWYTLRGLKTTEISTLVRLTPMTVRAVQSKEWFRRAFCKLSTEIGKDAVQTVLEGEVIPTIQKLVHLRDNADSDNVKLSAANSILDRFLGKPTVKVESKSHGTIDHVVHDAAKLQDEYVSIQKQLAARGLGTPSVGGN